MENKKYTSTLFAIFALSVFSLFGTTIYQYQLQASTNYPSYTYPTTQPSYYPPSTASPTRIDPTSETDYLAQVLQQSIQLMQQELQQEQATQWMQVEQAMQQSFQQMQQEIQQEQATQWMQVEQAMQQSILQMQQEVQQEQAAANALMSEALNQSLQQENQKSNNTINGLKDALQQFIYTLESSTSSY